MNIQEELNKRLSGSMIAKVSNFFDYVYIYRKRGKKLKRVKRIKFKTYYNDICKMILIGKRDEAYKIIDYIIAKEVNND